MAMPEVGAAADACACVALLAQLHLTLGLEVAL